jgi:hypothetical protein
MYVILINECQIHLIQLYVSVMQQNIPVQTFSSTQ